MQISAKLADAMIGADWECTQPSVTGTRNLAAMVSIDDVKYTLLYSMPNLGNHSLHIKAKDDRQLVLEGTDLSSLLGINWSVFELDMRKQAMNAWLEDTHSIGLS